MSSYVLEDPAGFVVELPEWIGEELRAVGAEMGMLPSEVARTMLCSQLIAHHQLLRQARTTPAATL